MVDECLYVLPEDVTTAFSVSLFIMFFTILIDYSLFTSKSNSATIRRKKKVYPKGFEMLGNVES